MKQLLKTFYCKIKIIMRVLLYLLVLSLWYPNIQAIIYYIPKIYIESYAMVVLGLILVSFGLIIYTIAFVHDIWTKFHIHILKEKEIINSND